jgi:cysteine synthase A
MLQRALIQLELDQGFELRDVNGGVGSIEPDAHPVRDNALMETVVDELPELGKAPTQRSSGVIRDLPEQLAQMFAAEGASIECKVCEQRTRLFGGRQGDTATFSHDLHLTQKPQLECRHCSAPGNTTLVVQKTTLILTRVATQRSKDNFPKSFTARKGKSRMARYRNILETIGNTPLVRLNRLAPPGVNVYVKIEAFNPMGSVKDRMARAVIERAEQTGQLRPQQTVVEATSGNTGIGLAMVCAQKGYPLVVTMAESFSIERRKLLRFLGAKVVLTPAAEKGSGMLAKAVELAETHGWFLCRQFENEANADVHSRTTAEEILADFAGERLDSFVTGFGTGGTLKGVARVLKERRPETRIVAAEPDNAQVLGSGIPQRRDATGRPLESHPRFRPHLMQGWAPDFISRLTEDAVVAGHIDEIMPVPGAEALRLARELALQEGIFVGTSSGGTLAAALEVARRSPPGANIVCMLPDTGERYLSTPLFEHIGEEMTPEELMISRSTPSCRFDVLPTAPVPAAQPTQIEVDADAARFVDEVVGSEPVVMFALEWCEFCWSVRKFLARVGISYRSVDLDSVEYQKNDLGGKIRAVLASRTGAKTIPQIFVGAEHVGGCTDLFNAWRDGSLQQRLAIKGIAYNADTQIDPYSLLPKWQQPRKTA